ncbi:hypothetical protein V1520DRAFT_33368 [Lipomyces starkeyi]|uniref:Uncharacterized protein n=1 Tax=Lipomyces starkeyi NRRL Y-11557 TaxID=675824 RepID=A0A1E3PV52_LIPST|nr:hypothetical protein LIPSTDRAFT_59432 [Lipomyces starkeyi NRRL Y-11557]
MPAEFDPLTSTLRPATDAIITLRVIKSFEYRTERNLILKDIDLTMTTVGDLLELAKKCIMTQGVFRAFRNVEYNTLKLYTKAHGSKTTNLIINLENDDWILPDHSKTLQECGIENETEISLFNRTLYEAYKLNPVEKW